MSALAWTDERIAYAMELHYGEGLKWACVALLMDASYFAVIKAVRTAERLGMRNRK